MKTLTIFLFLISSPAFAFSCYDMQTIIQKPIDFDEQRIQLTRQYQLEHYGISSDSIDIEPKMIVLHWTSIPTFDATFQLFNSPTLAGSTNKRDDLPAI